MVSCGRKWLQVMARGGKINKISSRKFSKCKFTLKEKGENNMLMAEAKAKKSSFSDFLKANKEKIQRITPKNPIISKDDEWYNENFWEEDYKE